MRRYAWVVLVAVAAVTLPAGARPRTPPDRSPPEVTFSTPKDALMIGAPIDNSNTTVEGGVRETGTGVRVLTVSFVECTSYTSYPGGGWACGYTGVSPPPSDREGLREGNLVWSCAGSAPQRCVWSVRVPLVPSDYLVVVEAIDRAGNRGSDMIHVTVI